MIELLTGPASAVILLVLLGYLLVRVFIVAHPKNERSVKEVFENMLLEIAGVLLIALAVLIAPLFF